MNVATTAPRRAAVLNLPNQLTAARIALAIGLFVLIPLQFYGPALFVFLVAAGTDWLDGYIARKYSLVTVLGRILDPFADKLIICGTFIFLAAAPNSGLVAWMAVVVIARELLITVIRSYLEQQGADFSASMSGKIKMVCQCLAAAFSLGKLAHYESYVYLTTDQLTLITTGLAWLAVLATVYSGWAYLLRAAQLLSRG